MTVNSGGEKKNKAGLTVMRGGLQLGGNGGAAQSKEEIAEARAAKFEQSRKDNNNRGVSKEG